MSCDKYVLDSLIYVGSSKPSSTTIGSGVLAMTLIFDTTGVTVNANANSVPAIVLDKCLISVRPLCAIIRNS